jgi:hypothetical protein
MSDTFQSHRERMIEFREKLQYVAGATGIAVAIGKKIVAVDMFDKPSTCQKVWNRLLSGIVLDALESQPQEEQVATADVEQMLKATCGMTWLKVEPVGEGEEYRGESGAEVHASALTFHESPVHLSVVVAG